MVKHDNLFYVMFLLVGMILGVFLTVSILPAGYSVPMTYTILEAQKQGINFTLVSNSDIYLYDEKNKTHYAISKKDFKVLVESRRLK